MCCMMYPYRATTCPWLHGYIIHVCFYIQTSHSTLFALYHLATNPDQQQILYEELQRINPTNQPATAEMLSEAKYLKAVIKENFRLNPVFPFVARMLTNDLVIRGFRIPAGVSRPGNVIEAKVLRMNLIPVD